ncbi:TetR/AcrR family transcriptional regulator C-terminal domain-containing protein [Nannocystis radixulma]|uniref:TetR/AcrR family transcriptional regulator C-terminal domain-containing protein n=1 Tax=Nannocystis radixulma TaxID=2995305 RepID=A0ABT5BLP3_9BACT|nr:TetR/AcrR family transcriptional regulator C-terminal domain-containing protein [Nannocystis radixulma]MDC0674444.1 TetR/AcrR family transcriptional regulator C-terminal domain-containing protein [Nannocystis radixulma]
MLRREQVVEAALRLLDEVGLDGLTMRRLAETLNVKAATLYWHVENKQELLEAMAEAMLADCGANPPEAAPGLEQAIELAGELRAALLARRDGARVFGGTYVAQPNTLRFSEQLLKALHEAGLPLRTVAWGAWTISYYVIGFTLEEQALSTTSGAGPQRLRAALDPLRFPQLAAAFSHLIDGDLEARFDHGLRLITAGLRAELATEAEPVRPADRHAAARRERRRRASRV